ncbi:MAG: hypothetical protein U0174_14440 [Polyangiaceae bacterium]
MRGWLKRAAVGGGAGALFALLSCATIPTYSLGPADSGGGVDASAADASTSPDGAVSDDGATLDRTSPKLRLFVSSSGIRGDFAANGDARVRADRFCADVAQEVPLPGVWRALLWADLTESPFTGPVKAEGAVWYQVRREGGTGDVVFSSRTGRSDKPILTQRGDSVATYVWTGGTSISATQNCSNWTSDAATATVGDPQAFANWFAAANNHPCGTLLPLFCIEIP